MSGDEAKAYGIVDRVVVDRAELEQEEDEEASKES
jgi:enoyl-CoA hydratase/carnithine racemase